MEGGDLLSLCGKPRLAGAGPLPVWVCESGLRSPQDLYALKTSYYFRVFYI